MKTTFHVRILTCAAVQGMGTFWEQTVGYPDTIPFAILASPEESPSVCR